MVHNIDCSGHTGKYAMKEGFSLVEVIIAVALLAFMALPILAYFTNAEIGRASCRERVCLQV